MNDDVQTIRDVLADSFAGHHFAPQARALGLDPDTVLRRRCETCWMDDGQRALVPGDDCPDCDGSGWVEVNRVVVVPVEDA